MPRGERAGFDTYWTTYGQGPRKAVMIHPSLAHSGSWGGMARYLSGALTMTAFDMPGHGQSGAWDGRSEYQGLSARVAESFCGDGPVDLVGHSFGGTVALRLAVERPDLIRSLSLVEPVLFAAALRGNPAMQARHDTLFAPFREAMSAGDTTAAARAFTAIWGDGTDWDTLPAAQRQRLAADIHLIEAGREALYDDPGGLLRPGVLEALDRPVLLIEGSRSPVLIPAIHDVLAARLPRTRRAVIAGAGHMAPITHASQVSAELLRFLSDT